MSLRSLLGVVFTTRRGSRPRHSRVASTQRLKRRLLVEPLEDRRLLSVSWTQLAPIGLAPSARYCHTAVEDQAHDRMIVFGGESTSGNGGGLNDVWVLSYADGVGGTPAWTRLTPLGTPPSGRQNASAVYDPSSNEMIVFGGDQTRGWNGGDANDTWVLTHADGLGGTPQWIQLAPAGTLPIPRRQAGAAYDVAHNRMIVVGGITTSAGIARLYDVCVLENANGLTGTPTWTEFSPGAVPPVVYAPVVYDPASNRLIMFDNNFDADTWVLSNADGLGGTPTWTKLSTTGTPPSSRGFSAVYDPATNQMTVFGGGGQSANYYNDVHTLSYANGLGGTPAWTQVNAGSPAPDPRLDHTAVYNPASGIMTVFGGGDNSVIFGDVWVIAPGGASQVPVSVGLGIQPGSATYTGSPYLESNIATTLTPGTAEGTISYSYFADAGGTSPISDPTDAGTYYVEGHFASSNLAQWSDADSSIVGFTIVQANAASWTQLAPIGLAPSARYGHTAVEDPAHDRMIIFSGESTSGNGGGLNDVWVLSYADGVGGTPAWTQLNPTGTAPSGRYNASAVYDPSSNEMIVFGGDQTRGWNGGDANDTWVLTHADGLGGTPQWIRLNPAGTLPIPRRQAGAAYDVAHNRMIVVGGITTSAGIACLYDVCVLENANGLTGTPTWTEFSPGAVPPTVYAPVVYDPASNQLIMFDSSSAGPYNNTWVLSNADGLGGTPAWTKLPTTGTPPSPRIVFSAVYDPATNQMTVFGGEWQNYYNDVYTLSHANGLGGTPAWTQVNAGSPAPAPRDGHTAVYNPASGIMTVFGGGDNSVIFGDVWVIAPGGASQVPVSVGLGIQPRGATYTGSPYLESNIATTLTPGTAVGTISYSYFADAGGTSAIADPTDAGTYYVQAHFTSSDTTQWTNADSPIAGFAIAKAALSVTANNASKTYDTLAYSGGSGVSFSGFVDGETKSVLGGTLVYSGSAQGAVDAGTYVITPGGLTSGNYDITFNDGTLTVNKAALTGVATTQDALNYIGKQGSLTIALDSISGLQGSDTVASVFASARFTLQIGSSIYDFAPSVSVDSVTNAVYLTYTLRGGTAAGDALRHDLALLDADDGTGVSTSASKASVDAFWVDADSTDYMFADDCLTRLFAASK